MTGIEDGLRMGERRSLTKTYIVEYRVEGPNAVFECPECEEEITTSASRQGDDVPVKHNCGFSGKVRLKDA